MHGASWADRALYGNLWGSVPRVQVVHRPAGSGTTKGDWSLSFPEFLPACEWLTLRASVHSGKAALSLRILRSYTG